MTKKRAAPQPAKSSSALKLEAEQILNTWKEAASRGMGKKGFAPAVLKRYEPRLRAKILEKLKDGDVFDARAKANTKAVAKDIGKVCAMLTSGSAISKDTFQQVFLLMNIHPKCPRTVAGGGTWCDVPL